MTNAALVSLAGLRPACFAQLAESRQNHLQLPLQIIIYFFFQVKKALSTARSAAGTTHVALCVRSEEPSWGSVVDIPVLGTGVQEFLGGYLKAMEAFHRVQRVCPGQPRSLGMEGLTSLPLQQLGGQPHCLGLPHACAPLSAGLPAASPLFIYS